MMIHTIGRRFGHASPIGETIHTLHDVVQAGYLDYVAVGRATCNGHLLCIKDKLTPFIRCRTTTTWSTAIKRISALARSRGFHLLAVSSHDLYLHRRASIRAQVAIASSISLECVIVPIVGTTPTEVSTVSLVNAFRRLFRCCCW
ncbi:hypothetical protein BKA93DRAFT_518519 [Sparassis latifolia]